MERKYKDKSGKVHQIDDRFTLLLPSGCDEISDAEAIDLLNNIKKAPVELKRQAEQAEIDAVRSMPITKSMRRMTRTDVISEVDAAFPAGPQRDLIKKLALIAFVTAIENDRNDR